MRRTVVFVVAIMLAVGFEVQIIMVGHTAQDGRDSARGARKAAENVEVIAKKFEAQQDTSGLAGFFAELDCRIRRAVAGIPPVPPGQPCTP